MENRLEIAVKNYNKHLGSKPVSGNWNEWHKTYDELHKTFVNLKAELELTQGGCKELMEYYANLGKWKTASDYAAKAGLIKKAEEYLIEASIRESLKDLNPHLRHIL